MNYTTAMVQLPLVCESTHERVRTPEDIYRVCSDLCNLAQEVFQVLCLNAKNCLINRHMVTMGLVDASLVHPREVLRAAITESASAFIAVHNHPSGDPTPSAEDVRITKQLIEAGRIIDIKLLDHVILGRASQDAASAGNARPFLSMREEGLCQFG